jgi:hypothetical protein
MRECDRRSHVIDRKLDKIEDKVAAACGKFDDAARRIYDGVKERHAENQMKIDALDTKLDALPWKLLTWAGAGLAALAGCLGLIVKGKLGL